jgi:hypothetical protein
METERCAALIEIALDQVALPAVLRERRDLVAQALDLFLLASEGVIHGEELAVEVLALCLEVRPASARAQMRGSVCCCANHAMNGTHAPSPLCVWRWLHRDSE